MSKSQQIPGAQAPAPGGATTSRAQEMLLDYLRDHDADPPACPVCGYSLKALTRPVCPECGKELVLTVGAMRPPLGWLFVAVAPGFFSGIAAVFLLVPILGQLLFGDGRWEPLVIALDLFGWSSGVLAIIIAGKRHRFLAQSRTRQRWCAIIIWLAHLAALGLFILLAAMNF